MNTQTMIFLIVWWLGGLAATIYLVVNNHPWFAAFIILATCSISIKWDDDKKKGDGE
jgi:hypothetical protein